MKLLRKMHSYFINLSIYNYIFRITIISYLFNILVAIFLRIILRVDSTGTDSHIYSNFITQLFLSVILAPILETIVFQSIPIGVMNRIKLLQEKSIVKIFVSSILFAAIHIPYGWINVVTAFNVGIMLAYTYIMCNNKGLNPLFYVILNHSLTNLISVILLLLSGTYL